MTLLFIDSFDHYCTTEIPDKGYSVGTSHTIVPGGGRRGGQAISSTGSSVGSIVTKDLPVDSDTLVVGCALKMSSFEDTILLDIINSTGFSLARLNMTTSGALEIICGTKTAITAAGAFTPTQYNHYELKYIKGTGADAFCQLRKDGVILLTISDGEETDQAAAVDLWRNVSSFKETTADDLYILNGLGVVNNDYLGDVRVDAHWTDADGATVSFTASSAAANFTHIDDNPCPDRDSTFVESGTISARAIYSVDAASLGTAIHGVQQAVFNRKTDAGTVTVDLITEKPSGSGEKINGSGTASDNYEFALAILETDPDDSTTWTDAKVNAEEFGFKVNNIVA